MSVKCHKQTPTLPTSQRVLILCPLELTIWIYSLARSHVSPISEDEERVD